MRLRQESVRFADVEIEAADAAAAFDKADALDEAEVVWSDDEFDDYTVEKLLAAKGEGWVAAEPVNAFAKQRIECAYSLLLTARILLMQAQCPKTLVRVRAAISSVKGAMRAAANRKYRDQRRTERAKAKK